MTRGKKGLWFYTIVIILLIAIGLNVYQLPYYVIKPGDADVVSKAVHVKGGYKGKGNFLLMTVLVGKANIYEYLWAKMHKYEEILPDKVVQEPDETQKEYNLRQLNYMTSAQKVATYVAYKQAGKHPVVNYDGVLVLNVVSSMPASKELKPGDIIVKAAGHQVKTIKDVQAVMKGKKKGDKVQLTVKRNGKDKQLDVTVGTFPKAFTNGASKKTGIGIIESPEFKVNVKPSISFDTGSIGGPSAGLMMTLEIYEQLTKENIRKGYDIAGTGTISMDGTVGPIGGISEKVVAASRAGADYFFAPVADNEGKKAQATAKAIGTKMKVVPVKSFKDAIGFLKTLKTSK